MVLTAYGEGESLDWEGRVESRPRVEQLRNGPVSSAVMGIQIEVQQEQSFQRAHEIHAHPL